MINKVNSIGYGTASGEVPVDDYLENDVIREHRGGRVCFFESKHGNSLCFKLFKL